jgi:uncharacterized protein
MLVDANVLIYAISATSPHHEQARNWVTEALNGDERIALPWQTIGAFVRITTNPRVNEHPLTPEASWSFVAAWLEHDLSGFPRPERVLRPSWANSLPRLHHQAT